MRTQTRVFVLFLALTALSTAAYFSYPFAKGLFIKGYTIAYANYQPKEEIKVEVDTSKLSPATAVPILMYHGIVDEVDGVNTTHGVFIKQMEMLKREGYQTISIEELDEFYQGKFTLPAKPIIITFDDGRKDSYYPVDDLFAKLGYKATIFVATIKAREGDSFYLNWDELAKMRDSGRWEIEAHGRRSHEDVVTDDEGTKGRYLAARIYRSGGLESIEGYKKRVEQDYLDGINDLKAHLGLDPHYFAIPLNTYGAQLNSNYDRALAFNQEMTKKYFRMAFIETIVYDRNLDDTYRSPDKHFGIYNYPDEDPYTIRRVEVKNMSPGLLLGLLNRELPSSPGLDVSVADAKAFEQAINLRYGETHFVEDGLHLKPVAGQESAKVWFGRANWANYTVEAQVKRLAGRSVVLLGYVRDNLNSIAFGFTDNGLFLRKIVNNEKTELMDQILIGIANGTVYQLKMVFKDGTVSASVNDRVVATDVPVPASRGMVGFFTWGDGGDRAEGVLSNIRVTPL